MYNDSTNYNGWSSFVSYTYMFVPASIKSKPNGKCLLELNARQVIEVSILFLFIRKRIDRLFKDIGALGKK